MKKITLGFFALFSMLSFTSQAASQKAPSPNVVSIPCFNGGLTFGLAGLYLRPSRTQLDYALVYPESLTTFRLIDFASGRFENVKPDYHWGYSANIGYRFPCSGNDVRLGYTHYNKDDDDRFFRSNEFVQDVGIGLVDASVSTTVSGRITSEYQTVDLDFGQHLLYGCDLKMRFLGGVRYADLDQQLNTAFIEAPESSLTGIVVDSHTHQKTSYEGVGPRLGLEAAYNIGCGFGIVGQLDTALLVGDTDSRFSSDQVISLVNVTSFTLSRSIRYQQHTRIVPNIDGRLSLDYSYRLCSCPRSRFTVEAGYYVNRFFNTVDRISISQTTAPERRGRQTIASSFDGPYVGIQVSV